VSNLGRFLLAVVGLAIQLFEPSSATALLAARKTLAQLCVLIDARVRLPLAVAVRNVGYTCENPAETHQQ
jgi:FixJ family two-component response regulator